MQLPSFVRAFLIELSLAWQERVPLRHWHALRTPQRFKLIFFLARGHHVLTRCILNMNRSVLLERNSPKVVL